MTDLELAYAALNGKQAAYDRLWAYYDGNQPLAYSTTRLRDMFRDINTRFVQNWCAVVVDACLDRINLKQLAGPNDAASQQLAELWQRSGLELDEDDVHLAMLVCGESFVIAWPDADNQPQAYYNDPRLCHVFYEADNPRQKRFAAKWWVGDDEKRYLTLYYADRLEYYVSTGKSENVQSASSFQPADVPTAPNPYGQIPVFHFRRERRAIRSELANVTTLQDAINKLLADMMVAAEFGAFPQRWVISQSDPGNLKNAPSFNWWIPAGDGQGQPASVGQLAAADLANYLTAIDKQAQAAAIITRTPKHYLLAQGGDPSGEALIAMEAPLNKKCQRYIENLQATWREVASFVALLGGTAIDPLTIMPVFDEPETVQPRTQAEIVQLQTAAGIPLATALRRMGWSDAELAQLDEDQQAADARQQATLAQVMLNAERRFNAGESE